MRVYAGILAAMLTASASAAQRSSTGPREPSTRVRAKPATKPPAAGPGTAIVLPPRLLAGQHATLAVLDIAGRLVPGAAVELNSGEHVKTDVTGRVAFTAPAVLRELVARLPGRNVKTSAAVVDPVPNPPDGVQVFDYPQIISVTDRFVIEGSGFRGVADANRVMLGEDPAVVLAASPVSLVVLPGPHVSEGLAQLLVEVGGRSPGPMPVTLVSLHVAASTNQLAPGEKGKLVVRVRGTEQRVAVEARNWTPHIVELTHGNFQRLVTSGGAYNIAEVELRGLRTGHFSVAVRLTPVATGSPETVR